MARLIEKQLSPKPKRHVLTKLEGREHSGVIIRRVDGSVFHVSCAGPRVNNIDPHYLSNERKVSTNIFTLMLSFR